MSDGYTNVPNALLDAMPELGPAGTQIALCLMRWMNAPRPPTNGQVSEQTGLTKRWVIANRKRVEAVVLSLGRNTQGVNSVHQNANSVHPPNMASGVNSVHEMVNSVHEMVNSVHPLIKIQNKRHTKRVHSISPNASVLSAPKIESEKSTTQFQASESISAKVNLPSAQQVNFAWLRETCVANFANDRLGKIAAQLVKAGSTDDQRAKFARWWGLIDWRGKQGQPPTPEQVWQMWPVAQKWDCEMRGAASSAMSNHAAKILAVEEALKSW